jgi:hypothetical protein
VGASVINKVGSWGKFANSSQTSRSAHVSRSISRSILPAVLAVGAIGIAACGSSNSSSAYGNRGAAYGATSTAAAASGSGNLPASTPITDSRMHAGFVKGAEAGGATPSQAASDADCIVKGLPGVGVNTAGDLSSKKDSPEVKALSVSCAKQAGVAAK